MPYVFNFLGKKTNTHIMDTCVCPNVHVWTETKKNTQVMIIFCPSAHVWSYCRVLSFLQNTTSVAIFWYSWYFCGYFVYLQPHKTDSHTGKKTPKFMDKSSHKTPFCGSVRPFVCPAVCVLSTRPSVCLLRLWNLTVQSTWHKNNYFRVKSYARKHNR